MVSNGTGCRCGCCGHQTRPETTRRFAWSVDMERPCATMLAVAVDALKAEDIINGWDPKSSSYRQVSKRKSECLKGLSQELTVSQGLGCDPMPEEVFRQSGKQQTRFYLELGQPLPRYRIL